MPIVTKIPQLTVSEDHIPLIVCHCTDAVINELHENASQAGKLIGHPEPIIHKMFSGDIIQWTNFVDAMGFPPIPMLLDCIHTDTPTVQVAITNYTVREKLVESGIPYYYIINSAMDTNSYYEIKVSTEKEEFKNETVIPVNVPNRGDPDSTNYFAMKYIICEMLKTASPVLKEICFNLSHGFARV